MKRIVLVGVALLFLLGFLASGAIAIVWAGAQSRDEVSRLFPNAVLPDSWKAVLVNHGHFSEWKLGLMKDNMLGFSLNCFFALIALTGFVKILSVIKRLTTKV